MDSGGARRGATLLYAGYRNAEESATSGDLGEFFQELRPASGIVEEEGGKEFEKVG